jgi:tripartite-type tricarboxylate transporter receptor subunit TctC
LRIDDALRIGEMREGRVKLPRRRFLGLAAAASALSAVPRSARAQSYPSKPVRVIVPYAPGGDTDFVARFMGQWLSERLGQPFIIENRPGAGTNIGTEAAVRSPPDGYTLLLCSPPAAINATLYEKLSFNFLRDMAPVAGVTRAPFVLVVNPSVPANTVSDFIAYAKGNPRKISMASAGVGSGPHLAGELFKIMAGIDLVHVPYRGQSPALTDLLSGQVQMYFGGLPTTIAHVRSGKLRALAASTATRTPVLPDVPALAEILPGYEAGFWGGFAAPAGTPAPIIATLNREINAALADPKVMARLADLGGTALAGSPADFRTHIAAETEKWGKVIRTAGIKPE